MGCEEAWWTHWSKDSAELSFCGYGDKPSIATQGRKLLEPLTGLRSAKLEGLWSFLYTVGSFSQDTIISEATKHGAAFHSS
jgi:hypothetical protein